MVDFSSPEHWLPLLFIATSLGFFFAYRGKPNPISGFAAVVAAIVASAVFDPAQVAYAVAHGVEAAAKAVELPKVLARAIDRFISPIDSGALGGLLAYGLNVFLLTGIAVVAVVAGIGVAAVGGACSLLRRLRRGEAYAPTGAAAAATVAVSGPRQPREHDGVDAFMRRYCAVLRAPDIRAGLYAAVLMFGAVLSLFPFWRDITAAMAPDFGPALNIALAGQGWPAIWLGLLLLLAMASSRAALTLTADATAPAEPLKDRSAAAEIWTAMVTQYAEQLLFAAPGYSDVTEFPSEPRADLEGPDDNLEFARRLVAIAERHGRQAGAGLGALEATFAAYDANDDGLLLFSEPLAAAHLEIALELGKRAQDVGLLTIVICPDRDVGHLLERFETLRGQSVTSMNIRIDPHSDSLAASSTTWAAANGTSTIILAGESNVPSLIDGFCGPSREFPIEALGQVICFDLPSMEMYNLKLQFRRLSLSRTLALGRTHMQLKGICQGSGWKDIAGPATKLFGDLVNPIRVRDRSVKLFSRPRHPYWLVWRAEPETARAIADSLQEAVHDALPSTAAVAAPFVLAGCEVVAFDPNDRFDSDALAKAFDRRTTGDSAIRRAAAILRQEAKRPKSGLQVLKPPPLVMLRIATSDLGVQFGDGYQAKPNGELVVNLLSADYPLRAYHIARMLRSETQSALHDAAPSLAPSPEGGLPELVRSLQMALERDHADGERGLPPDEVEAVFLKEIQPELRRRLRITPTVSGVTRLFNVVLGPDAGISIDASYANADGSSMRLAMKGDASASASPSNAANDVAGGIEDRRLLYLPGQTYVANGQRWKVAQYDRRPAPDVASGASPLPTYFNEFVYGFGNGASDGAVWGHAQARNSIVVLGRQPWSASDVRVVNSWLLAASFWRRPRGYFARAAGQPTGAPDKDPFPYQQYLPTGAGDERFLRKYAAVWHLAFAADDISEAALPEAAFSLAVLLQDVIRSLFSKRAYRLQVVSPQAAELQAAARAGSTAGEPFSNFDRFLLRIHPSLEAAPFGLGRPGIAAGRRGEAFPWTKQASSKPHGRGGAPGARFIDIFILEDSNVDMGVVRELHEKPLEFQAELSGYCAWLKSVDWRNPYYSFGGDTHSTVLDFAAAAALLPHIDKAPPRFAGPDAGPIWQGDDRATQEAAE